MAYEYKRISKYIYYTCLLEIDVSEAMRIWQNILNHPNTFLLMPYVTMKYTKPHKDESHSYKACIKF